MDPTRPTGFGIGPSIGGFLEIPAPPIREPEWEDVQPGWGQFPGIMTVQWGGPSFEFEVRVSEAPVITQRGDFPNRPRPKNHGGHH